MTFKDKSNPGTCTNTQTLKLKNDGYIELSTLGFDKKTSETKNAQCICILNKNTLKTNDAQNIFKHEAYQLTLARCPGWSRHPRKPHP